MTPDSALAFWGPRLARAASSLFDFARSCVRPNDVVWDVGANCGLFSFAAAARAGAGGVVLAIEPDPFLCALLERSIRRAPASAAPVRLLPVVVSDRVGTEDLLVAERGRSSSHLARVPGSSQAQGARERLSIRSVTLDSLRAETPPPHLIKLDVETAEALVLGAAGNVLSEARPILLCEISAPCAVRTGRILESHGYVAYDWDSGLAPAGRSLPRNALCCPRETDLAQRLPALAR